MWDQFWQKLVQVQISIVVQSNHRTAVLLCLNNLYLSFRRFNEWVAYVLDTILCTIQSMHTMTDSRGIRGVFFFSFPEPFWKTVCVLVSCSCLSCRPWITRMLPRHRGCKGRRKATEEAICLPAIFFFFFLLMWVVVLHRMWLAASYLPFSYFFCPPALSLFATSCFLPLLWYVWALFSRCNSRKERFWPKCHHLSPTAPYLC